jgi:hypothetical protein
MTSVLQGKKPDVPTFRASDILAMPALHRKFARLMESDGFIRITSEANPNDK